ncbi:MAG: type I restriction endonuclease subunit R [Chromatiales bacterium]|nr:type I restriction endonuclease subunit R [Chromatiales bacterium]
MSLKIDELRSSQIPALQLLAKLGYQVLPPAAALAVRGGSTGNVLLESILTEQLHKINRIHYQGREYLFSEANIQEAVQKFKGVRRDGRGKTQEAIYDYITLPVSLTQTVENNTRSFDLNYIDWKDITNNVFHALPEFAVERAHSNAHARPDIVLFINGIPLCVIECKSPEVEVEEAISQHIRNQGTDYIPNLFAYAQLVLAVNKNEAEYATAGTSEKFWSVWQELEDKDDDIQALVNQPLSAAQKEVLFTDEFAQCRQHFDEIDAQGGRQLTEQDKAIYSLCRPERLLDLTYRFTIFEHGAKKIARYQQFFVVHNALKRVKQYDGNRREGGIVWHTQGSGKSLTMVMMVRALISDTEISNPRILLVTDRTDLDEQLGNTFKQCGLERTRATTGKNLTTLLKAKTPIITTVIHKFNTALKAQDYVDDDTNLFVLVDESHRTNFAFFAAKMRKMLPNACYIGFTGTPLMKKDKDSFRKFGRLIEPSYPIEQAVKDKTIVSLLYEARHVGIKQDQADIDLWFERHTDDLSDEQKADLKRKYARARMLNKTEQVIYARAWDISMHFRENWQDTEFKAQLVAPDKLTAIRYHHALEDIGCVSSEVVISSPDTREGHQKIDDDSTAEVVRFWRRMMNQYGTPQEYEKQIIDQFKYEREPEIIIVVDKLLTGFDAPRNTVLYLCKNLREHSLLQAIARVNRIYEGKDHGYIVDYDRVLAELDKALIMYDAFKDFDEEDIAKALISIREEIDKLPVAHAALWDIFKEITNKNDNEAFERLLADQNKRDDFYECLTEYSKTLAIALSSDKFLSEIDEQELDRYRGDLKHFMKLRKSVQLRYAEKIDFGVYENRIEKLLDRHIHADREVIQISEPIDIMDERSVNAVMKDNPIHDQSVRSTAARADAIAHATKKTLKEKFKNQDPTFYEKFSKLIQQAIDDFRQGRIIDTAYLKIAMDVRNQVSSNTRDDVPEAIRENREACAYFGVMQSHFKGLADDKLAEQAASETALYIQKILNENTIVDFWRNFDACNSIKSDIDDYLSDDVKARFNISLPGEQVVDIISRVMKIAESRRST